MLQYFHNALSRLAIPQWWRDAGAPVSIRGLSIERFQCFMQQPLRIRANKLVRSELDRDRALSVLTIGKTWDAQVSGFFLNSPGIGQYQCCALDEAKKIQIGGRRHVPYAITED